MTINLKKKLEVCANCGALVSVDTMTRLYNGEYVCSDCANNSLVMCDECNEYVLYSDTHTARDRYGDSIYICPECIEDYNYCPECGSYVHDWCFDDAFNMCNDCAENLSYDLIQSYHSEHENGLQFFGDADYSYIKGHFGIELEVSTDSPEYVAFMLKSEGCRTDLYHLEHDCSVEGFEMVFQPMTMEYMKEHMQDIVHIFNTLQYYGACSESGNGLHVHVSRSAFGADASTQARRIALCMKAFASDNYNRMLNASGRTYDAGDWCRNNASIGSFDRKIQAAQTRRADRYLAVNVQNYNTVEFRLGRSTTNASDFMRWIETIGTIVRRSESITPQQATDLNQWFVGAPDALIEWLNGRDAMIQEPIQEITSERYNEIIGRLVYRMSTNMYYLLDSEPDTTEILRNVCNITPQELRALGYNR